MGSDGGRGSYGGEREWCRVLERGNSPGLIIAHVRSLSSMSMHHCLCLHVFACFCVLLPVSACCCPCPHMPVSMHHFLCPCIIACVHTSLPTSTCHCPCPCIIACVCTSLPMSACFCLHLSMFVGSCFHLWAWVVAFVGGQLSSFVGNGTVWWWGAVGGWWCVLRAGVDMW